MRHTLELVLTMTLLVPGPRVAAQISPGPLASPHQHLEGAGNCGQCHAPRKGSVSQQCANCHRDIAWLVERGRGFHAKAATASRKDCVSCHPDHAGRDFALIQWPGGAAARFNHQDAGWVLEQSHRDLKCDACHATKYRSDPAVALSKRKGTAGWIGLETSCVSCHREDDAHKGALSPRCETCHDAGDWKRAVRFNHDSTKYALTGEHRQVSCDACHASAQLPVSRDVKGERIPVYKPVPHQECSTCHRDPHQGRLSSSCGECHTTRGFGVVDRRDFNHALTRYPLKGRHARVSCAGCHGASMEKPSPQFGTCAACHADPHRGEATLRGATVDCASCHGVEGFSPSTYTTRQHSAAPYALEGKHLGVACGGCHRPSMTTNGSRTPRHLRMSFATCEDCHTDVHAGQLAGRTETSCASCHAVGGWVPSLYSANRHGTLALSLEGRHGEIACSACHGATRTGLPAHISTMTLGAANVALRVDPACGSCHVDVHDRWPSGKGAWSGATCKDCHATRQWNPSLVDARVHGTFSYPLEGAHRAVACSGCHIELRGEQRTGSTLVASARNIARLPFTPRQSTTCASCHETPHGAQFAARKDNGACESCHSPRAFAPADRFDHDRDASFSLKGAHVRVACARCHMVAPGTTGPVRYRPVSARCESCHSGGMRS